MLNHALHTVNAVIAMHSSRQQATSRMLDCRSLQQCVTDLLVDDEQTTQRHTIICQDIVFLADLPLQVGHKRIIQVTNATLFPVCASIQKC